MTIITRHTNIDTRSPAERKFALEHKSREASRAFCGSETTFQGVPAGISLPHDTNLEKSAIEARPANSSTWTEEREARLVELVADGWSSGRIAVEFGIGRGAIAGKVHRLHKQGRCPKLSSGFQSRKGQLQNQSGPRKSKGPTLSVQIMQHIEAHPEAKPADIATTFRTTSEYVCVVARRAGKPFGHVRSSYNRKPKAERRDEPVSLKLSLVELTDQTCKWPHGDPKEDGFHFCGHETFPGSPWCEAHHARAYGGHSDGEAA